MIWRNTILFQHADNVSYEHLRMNFRVMHDLSVVYTLGYPLHGACTMRRDPIDAA